MTDSAYIADKIRHQCTEDGDCLLWTGKVNKANAPVSRGSVRREYWTAVHGRIPKGKVPHPTCGRPTCLEHLELTTISAIMKATIARPDVKARWQIASRHRTKKLDLATVREIRQATGTQREKAERFNVTQGLICRIERHAIWKESSGTSPFAGLGARP